MYRTIVLSACLACALPASAAQIYRCIDAKGAIEYRDEPCSRAAGQTGAVVVLPPLNIVRDLDQSAARAAAAAAAARQQAAGTAGSAAGATPLWQIPGGLPLPGKPEVTPQPPPPAATPPASMPANATSSAAAAAIGNPTLPPTTAPKSPPSVPVNATSAGAAAATGVAGR